MQIKFQPLYSRILVKRIEAAKQTTGGIYIPEAHSEAPLQGTAVAVGPGRYDPISKSTVPPVVKVGDEIIFQAYAGHPIQFGEIELICMEEEEVLGIVK